MTKRNGKASKRALVTTRRQMLGGLLAASGAGLALPAAAAAHELAAPAAATATPPASVAPAPASYLDPHQRATLEAMSLRILPGTDAAETVAFIDRLLSVIPEDQAQYFATGDSDPQGTVSVPAPARQNLLDALGAFEAVSRRQHGLPFKDLSEARQIAILQAASQAPAPAPATANTGEEPMRRVTMYDHFLHLKNWIAGSYFSSEAGTRALGWNGMVYFPSFPGCPHGGH